MLSENQSASVIEFIDFTKARREGTPESNFAKKCLKNIAYNCRKIFIFGFNNLFGFDVYTDDNEL